MIPLVGPAPGDFPPVSRALDEPDGLLAVGGDLSVERLLAAYCRGIFPWFGRNDPILWWSPNPRALFFPGQFHVSRSLAKWRSQGRYRVTTDTAFAAVVDGCAAPRGDDPETWIVPAMREAFVALHEAGHARSVEVWQEDTLVGGLFGTCIGRAAFGESMFSRAPNASKFALAAILVDGVWGEIDFLDTQFATAHLDRLGVTEIPRAEFVARLTRATAGSGICDTNGR
jgi:leucyl/phenylalanyl-tRNA--protein transferase